MASSSSRAWGYGLAALGCLVLAGFLGWRGGSETAEVPLHAKPSSSPARSVSFSLPSAPAPEGVPPQPSETLKALQPLTDARPEVQAQRRSIEAKAASGVDAVMQGWREQPLDQEVAVQTVMALKRIGTPEAEAALAALKKESPTAGSVMAILDQGGRR